MASRAKKAEVPPLNGDVFPASDGPALQLVALDAIELPEQVRTRFDEDSLNELAADLKANGMLQAVLLRPVGDGRYNCIAGARRVRSARIAGFSAVPALVSDVSDEQAEDAQLAENIQREELSLEDEARAVRRRYDRLGKVELVAALVHKSPAWVSKRLSLTYEGFDWRAKKLMEDGITEDVELLLCVAKIAALDQRAAGEIDADIRAGKAGRKEARALLTKLKKPASAKANNTTSVSVSGADDDSLANKPEFDARVVLCQLTDDARAGQVPVDELVMALSDEQRQAVLDVCRDDYQSGEACAGMDGLALLRLVARRQCEVCIEDWAIPAFAMGAFGMEFELGVLLSELALTAV